MRSFNEVLREGQITDLNGGWKIKTRRSQEKGVYDLLVKGPAGESGEFEEFFWYNEGYDQVFSGPSKRQYYLQSKIGYNAGNGSGQSSPGTPFITHGLKKTLTELLNEGGLESLQDAIERRRY
jgi:hypothetical protein